MRKILLSVLLAALAFVALAVPASALTLIDLAAADSPELQAYLAANPHVPLKPGYISHPAEPALIFEREALGKGELTALRETPLASLPAGLTVQAIAERGDLLVVAGYLPYKSYHLTNNWERCAAVFLYERGRLLWSRTFGATLLDSMETYSAAVAVKLIEDAVLVGINYRGGEFVREQNAGVLTLELASGATREQLFWRGERTVHVTGFTDGAETAVIIRTLASELDFQNFTAPDKINYCLMELNAAGSNYRRRLIAAWQNLDRVTRVGENRFLVGNDFYDWNGTDFRKTPARPEVVDRSFIKASCGGGAFHLRASEVHFIGNGETARIYGISALEAWNLGALGIGFGHGGLDVSILDEVAMKPGALRTIHTVVDGKLYTAPAPVSGIYCGRRSEREVWLIKDDRLVALEFTHLIDAPLREHHAAGHDWQESALYLNGALLRTYGRPQGDGYGYFSYTAYDEASKLFFKDAYVNSARYNFVDRAEYDLGFIVKSNGTLLVNGVLQTAPAVALTEPGTYRITLQGPLVPELTFTITVSALSLASPSVSSDRPFLLKEARIPAAQLKSAVYEEFPVAKAPPSGLLIATLAFASIVASCLAVYYLGRKKHG